VDLNPNLIPLKSLRKRSPKKPGGFLLKIRQNFIQNHRLILTEKPNGAQTH